MLNWEKAFGNVSQEALHQALARVNIDIAFRNLIKHIDKNLTFTLNLIEFGHTVSAELPQTSGLKQ